jgi:hypothetical protein
MAWLANSSDLKTSGIINKSRLKRHCPQPLGTVES